MRFIIITAVGLILTSCGDAAVVESKGNALALTSEPFDENAATEVATEAVADESFQSVGDTSACTDDCGGHDAGFEWAKEQGATDTTDCGGDSDSFIQGCEAYVEAIEEKVEEARTAAENGEAVEQ